MFRGNKRVLKRMKNRMCYCYDQYNNEYSPWQIKNASDETSEKVRQITQANCRKFKNNRNQKISMYHGM